MILVWAAQKAARQTAILIDENEQRKQLTEKSAQQEDACFVIWQEDLCRPFWQADSDQCLFTVLNPAFLATKLFFFFKSYCMSYSRL